MKAHALSASFVERATSQGGKLTEYPDGKVPGLALRVTPTGVKSWTIRYRMSDGLQRRLSLGRFPAVTLSKARDKAISALSDIADGKDPANEKKQARAKAIAARSDTITAIGKHYFQDALLGRHRNRGKPKRSSTLALEKYYFEKHVAHEFGPRPISSLTRAEIQSYTDRLADGYSPSTARQCRVVLQRLFAYAQWHEITDKDPCQFVQVPDYISRERVLSDRELETIWIATTVPTPGDFPLSPSVAVAIRLLIVTLQRRSEITGMHTREIDREARVWIIPGDRTKNHRTHVVPLTDTALDLIDLALSLAGQEEGYLFPSPRDNGRPIKPGAVTLAFSRLKEARRIEDASPHDLRRTGATNLTGEGLSVSRFIVSQVLNHVSDTGGSSAVTAVYDRNAYLAQKRHALDAWAGHLAGIVSGEGAASNVVALR